MNAETTAIPTCQEVVDLLEAWSEGRLAAEAERPYAVHLELCPPCASIASTYRALSRVARAALAVEMPQDARARLRRVLVARLAGGQ